LIEYSKRADMMRDILEGAEITIEEQYGIQLTKDENQNLSDHIWEFLKTLKEGK